MEPSARSDIERTVAGLVEVVRILKDALRYANGTLGSSLSARASAKTTLGIWTLSTTPCRSLAPCSSGWASSWIQR
jgi:hypothetical protein